MAYWTPSSAVSSARLKCWIWCPRWAWDHCEYPGQRDDRAGRDKRSRNGNESETLEEAHRASREREGASRSLEHLE